MTAIRTSIGLAGFGDNALRGFSVRDDLFGKTGYFGAFSIALGNGHLSASQETLLADLSLACTAPDPRIWPLKVTWLLGSFGSFWAATAGAYASFSGALVGPAAIVAASALSETLVRRRREGSLESWLAKRLERKAHLPGFGIPGRAGGRNRDERIVLIQAAARKAKRYRKHLEAVDHAAEVVASKSPLEPNGGLYLAAALLDLPVPAPLIGPFATLVLGFQVSAHAQEAATLRPAELRKLPLHQIAYEGAPQRRSPRAERISGEPND